MDKAKVPVVGKEYSYFDDGKINESRHDIATITEVIPYKDIDTQTKTEWVVEFNNCHWLYSKNTDYFIKSHLINANVDVVFVRTKDGGWFSLGWWGGRLDIDGKLLKIMNERMSAN